MLTFKKCSSSKGTICSWIAYLLSSEGPLLCLAGGQVFLSFCYLLFYHVDDDHGLPPSREMSLGAQKWVFLKIIALGCL